MSLNQINLFEKVLIEPLNQEANKLYIISGYATARMAMRHIEYAEKVIKKKFSINLIIGMCPFDGIDKNNHRSLKDLQSDKYNVDFKCDYIINPPAVHSKVYAWYKDDTPISGFVGSANYTQNAFSSSMREVLVNESPENCLEYYENLIGETINCSDDSVPELINIFDSQLLKSKIIESTEAETAISNDHTDLPRVTLTLLDSRTGNTPEKSGLNWGQRKGREPNQAYINIPAHIGRSGFFPERYETFTIITDDDKQIICVRAQDGGKGLHSTLNNSLLGEYFRYRLGLNFGEYITIEHLLKYGRTDVDIYRIDEENYYLDFSIH